MENVVDEKVRKRPHRKTMTVSMDEDKIAALNALAQEQMLSRSRLVELAVAELLKKAQKQTLLGF